MSISTPDSSGQGKESQRETTKENAAPPRPTPRRDRRAGRSADLDAKRASRPEDVDAEQHDDDSEPAKETTQTGEEVDRARKLAEQHQAQEQVTGKPETLDVTPVAQQGPRHGLFGVSGVGDTSGMGGLASPGGTGMPSSSSPRPYGGYFDHLADRFAKAYPGWSQAHLATVVDRGEMTFYVEKSHIAKIMKVARDDAELRFELLASLSGVDYYRDAADVSSAEDDREAEYSEARLHVVYHLLSMTFRRRVRFEIATSVADPHVPSVTAVYPTADWQERETYDMFGVVFDGHHALTRILMPDDWVGFPQRKDYSLGGIDVEYKGAVIPPPDERRSYSR